MKINIINFEGKPVEKLIGEVSKGIGTAYKPRAIRKQADAKAYEKEVLAIAEAKKTLIEGDAKIELIERARARLFNQELNRQINLEEIVEKSIEYLDENVSEQPVDENWRKRYFNKAQDISGKDMQEIWAKILAGEVSQPGTVNFRTLEVISNISKHEAEKFELACSLASSNNLIWKFKGDDSLSVFGLIYGDIMLLRDAGLVHDNDNLFKLSKVYPKTVAPNQQSGTSLHVIGKDVYQIKSIANPTIKEYRFSQLAFTTAGAELCQLIDVELNSKYIEQLIEFRKSEGYELIKMDDLSSITIY